MSGRNASGRPVHRFPLLDHRLERVADGPVVPLTNLPHSAGGTELPKTLEQVYKKASENIFGPPREKENSFCLHVFLRWPCFSHLARARCSGHGSTSIT